MIKILSENRTHFFKSLRIQSGVFEANTLKASLLVIFELFGLIFSIDIIHLQGKLLEHLHHHIQLDSRKPFPLCTSVLSDCFRNCQGPPSSYPVMYSEVEDNQQPSTFQTLHPDIADGHLPIHCPLSPQIMFCNHR